MKNNLRGLLGLIMVMTVFIAHAQDLKIDVVLNHLKTIKTQEHDGDELYFTTSEYQKNTSTVYKRIPKKPLYLTSKRAEELANFGLWSGVLKEGKAVTVIVALNEYDPMLMDPDELIGSMRVTFKNDKGTLKTKWSIPNRMDGPEVITGQHGAIQKFDLVGPVGRYEVYLSVKKK